MHELEILDRENPIAGNLPFSTMTVAVNTPGERIPSHGTDEWGQRYAYDLVPVITGDLPKAGSKDLYLKGSMFQQTLFGVPVENFQAWGQDIHSPFAGTVVSVQDGWEDRARPWLPKEIIRSVFFTKPPEGEDIRSLAGNNVVIKTEHGYLFLAHFQKNSILVEVGESISVGKKLGLVGNSGNSTMPHLHIHLMDGPDARTAKGIPFAFQNLERAAGEGKWEAVDTSFLDVLSRYRPAR